MKLHHHILFLIILILSPQILSESNTQQNHETVLREYCDVETDKSILLSGWFEWEPYQYMKRVPGKEVLAGADIEISRKVFQDMGVQLSIDKVSWDNHVQNIKRGAKDLGMGATYTRNRSEFAYFSEPYRYEENVLIISKDTAKNLTFDNIGQFLAKVRAENFKLGVLSGGVYSHDMINGFIIDEQNSDIIVENRDDEESLKKLLKNEIDGFLVDKMVGASLIIKHNAHNSVREIDLNIKAPISFMLSKKTTTIEFVNQLNKSIEKLKKDGTIDKITREYIFPVLFLQITSSIWYGYITIIGVIAYAISGVLIAFRENMTFLNNLIISFIPSIGICIFMDMINSPDTENLVIYSTKYMMITFATVIFSFAVFRSLEVFNKNAERDNNLLKLINILFIVTESIGQSAFLIMGVAFAMIYQLSPIELWGPVCAFGASNIGTVIRDIVSKDKIISIFSGTLRVEIGIVWSFIFSIFFKLNSSNPEITNITIGAIAVFVGSLISLLIVELYKIENLRYR